MRAASTGISRNLLTTLLLIAMLTLGALVVGLAGFFHGGEFNRKYSNKLMQRAWSCRQSPCFCF